MRRTYGAIVIFGNRRASMLRVTQQVMRSHSPTKGTRVKRNESLNSCDNESAVLRVLRAATMRSRTGWSEAGRSVPHRVALQSPAGDASVPLPPLRAISSWIAGSSSTTSAAGVSLASSARRFPFVVRQSCGIRRSADRDLAGLNGAHQLRRHLSLALALVAPRVWARNEVGDFR
jgi:hypothetical protein